MATDRQVDRRRPGRPRIGARVEVRIPDALFDDLWREARRRDMTIAEVIRDRCEGIPAVGKSQTAHSSVS